MKAFIACIALLWSSAGYAELEIGTVSTSGHPMTKNGALVGCEIRFTNLHWDYAYRHNKIGVSGSISMHQNQGTPSFLYKVVVEDFIENGTDISTRPSTPASINLVAPDGRSSKGLEIVSAESDTPGGRVNVYPLSSEFIDILQAILDRQSATILFNRRSDGLDVRVPVDFTIASTDPTGKKTRNNDAVLNFISCQRTIIKELLNSPRK